VLGANCDAELQTLAAEAAKISATLKSAGVELAVPNDKQLGEYGKELEGFAPEQLKEAMKTRSGEAYEALSKRGEIVKRNQDNRLEIAKLSIALSRLLPKERDPLMNAIRLGTLENKVELKSPDDQHRKAITRFMRRCGIACRLSGNLIIPAEEEEDLEREVKLTVSNRTVWVSEGVKAQLEENMQKISNINPRIQLKNAERQVKLFSDAEERDFASLQRQYLELIKERDELLRPFMEEENLSVKTSA